MKEDFNVSYESGEFTTTNKFQRINVRVPEKMHQWLLSRSAQTGLSMSSIVYLVLEKDMLQGQMLESLPLIQQYMELQNLKVTSK